MHGKGKPDAVTRRTRRRRSDIYGYALVNEDLLDRTDTALARCSLL